MITKKGTIRLQKHKMGHRSLVFISNENETFLKPYQKYMMYSIIGSTGLLSMADDFERVIAETEEVDYNSSEVVTFITLLREKDYCNVDLSN